jgi:heme exporter protein A
MTAHSLRFEHIVRGYGGLPVLRGVTGAIDSGQTLLVTGDNGSGKSTLLRCLAGLLAPESGSIQLIEGSRRLSTVSRRNRIGYLAPDLSFYEELTVREIMRLFARLRRVESTRADQLIEQVGLPPGRAGGALSSGMRQRLRWIWAMLHRPPLLLLDEPFQNLDPASEGLTRQMLDDHLEQGGMAVIATPSPLGLSNVAARLQLGL